MGRKHIALEGYLSKIPELYREKIVLLESYIGNRTMISFVFSCTAGAMHNFTNVSAAMTQKISR